eukprot:tig00020554_g10848.t1
MQPAHAAAAVAAPASRTLNLVVHLTHSMPYWNLAGLGLDKYLLELAKEKLPRWRVHVARDEAQLAEHLPAADALCAWTVGPDIAERAPRLRWLSTPAAGTDYVRGLPPHVTFTSSHGYHGIPMAEYCMGALLRGSRCLDAIEARRAEARRAGAPPPSYDDLRAAALGADELHGKTMAIVGCGSIGLHLAWRASAMGMHVIGVRRSGAPPSLSGMESMFIPPQAAASVSEWVPPEDRSSFLSVADVVVNVLPGTAANLHWFDEAAFALFKPGSTFVNVGRGATVDQAALLRALDRGAPARAVLDVTDPEPPARAHGKAAGPPKVAYAPPDHPLVQHPAVFATPHVSAYTPSYLRWGVQALVHQAQLAEAGAPLEHVAHGPPAPFPPPGP